MPTILVVENEASICDVLEGVLEDAGYQVMTAANGREGLAALAQRQPDLVLSDVMMPLMNGTQFCEAMQADPTYRTIPLVLMSAVDKSLQPTRCSYAAFISKPFDIEELLATVQRAIAQG
jgi:CheY-like chemotaxis protein